MATTKPSEEIELHRLDASETRVARPPHPPKLTLWTLLRSPFSTLQRILAFITTLIPYLSRINFKPTPSRRQLSPTDTASRFIREFEELYGRHHIPFETRGYADVTQHVKDHDLFLLVVLLSEEHDDTPAFAREVLCDATFTEWIRENEVVVWGANVADSEAHTVSNSLTCTRYPFVALIANIPPSASSSTPQMTLLTRVEGLVNTQQLTSTLATAVTRYRGVLQRRRALKTEQRQARELRRMQEEAYTNSLAQDRARQEQERVAQAESQRLEKERIERIRQAELRIKNREQWRLWKSADLRQKGLVGMKSEIGKTARVGLRLSGGERIIQIFPGDIALAEVYSFVECYELLFPPAGQNNTDTTLRNSAVTMDSEIVRDDVEKPEGYEHEFMFRLVVPYPRKVINCGFTPVKHESALWPSGSIVVEEIEESEDEDSEDEV